MQPLYIRPTIARYLHFAWLCVYICVHICSYIVYVHLCINHGYMYIGICDIIINAMYMYVLKYSVLKLYSCMMCKNYTAMHALLAAKHV